MAHFAQIDDNNVVVQVIVTNNNFPNEGYDWLIDNFEGTWIKTSYNGNIRKNFAGIGYSYREDLDAFIPPQPFSSWILNEDTCKWEPPVPYPNNDIMYVWDENSIAWRQAKY